MKSEIGKCILCNRENQPINFHHYIPKKLHSNKWFKKNFDISYMKQHGDMMCIDNCHKYIHEIFDEKDLGKNYNSLDKLLSHPKIQSYISWIKKQK